MVLPIFIENWNDQRIPPENIPFDPEYRCRNYITRLEMKLEAHRTAREAIEYELDKKFVRALSDKEFDEMKEKKAAENKRLNAKREEMEKERKKQVEGKQKEMKMLKKTGQKKKKGSRIRATDASTSVQVKGNASSAEVSSNVSKVSNASVSRDMAKEWAKTKK